MKCSDVLRPSRQLRFLRWTLPGVASAFSLPAVQHANRGPGVRDPVPAAGSCRLETFRTSQVSGEPLCLCALFYDPGRISRTLPRRCADAAPAMSTTKAPTIAQLSRLNHTALRLTVYASPGVLPHKTQNSFPAAGQALPDGIPTRRVPTRGFSDAIFTFDPPLPNLPGARTFRVFSQAPKFRFCLPRPQILLRG